MGKIQSLTEISFASRPNGAENRATTLSCYKFLNPILPEMISMVTRTRARAANNPRERYSTNHDPDHAADNEP